jgi:glycerophosphoryl diester phosphodiesterase
MSLDHQGLMTVRRLDPSIEIGLTVGASIGDLSRMDVDFLAVGMPQATAELIGRAHAAGKDVHVWTVNRPADMLRFMMRRADNLITDDPAAAVEARREWSEMSTAERVIVALRFGLGS